MVNNVSLHNMLKGIEQHNTSIRKAAATEKIRAVDDKLDLSSTGIDLQQLNMTDIPQVSQERLDALRDAIANGAYKIDNDQLAEAILLQNITES